MMRINQLLAQCQSPIESKLLRALYPRLKTKERDLLCAQYKLPDDYVLPEGKVYKPDFAFPHLKIAVYCDGWEHHKKKPAFHRDRSESRLLQSRGWKVLRFTGTQITRNLNNVVNEILALLYQVSDSFDSGYESDPGYESGENSKRHIAILNDEFRRQIQLYASGMSLQTSGKFFVTKRIKALSVEQQMEIYAQVKEFNNFTPDIDPDEEHDFGAIGISGIGEIFWKIDYYADEQMEWGSEDPSNPAQTFRVLTIMFADEL